MALITLTSDFGLSDYYVSSVKGFIYSELPVVHLIDLSHGIKRDDIAGAAFTVKQATKSFPEGSIHIISVNPTADADSPYVVVKHQGSYFIGTDNGFFSLLVDGQPESVFEIRAQNSNAHAFPMRDVFAGAACHLARGGAPELLGPRLTSIKQMMPFEPIIQQDSIRGIIRHIDGFGNLISNIPNDLYSRLASNREVRISLRSAQYTIRKVCQANEYVAQGDLACYYGGSGFLEIVIRSGSAAQLLGQEVNDSILIQFGN